MLEIVIGVLFAGVLGLIGGMAATSRNGTLYAQDGSQWKLKTITEEKEGKTVVVDRKWEMTKAAPVREAPKPEPAADTGSLRTDEPKPSA